MRREPNARGTGAPALGPEYLIEVSQKLSLAHTQEEVIRITRTAARRLCGSDGASFILREGDLCFYVDEDAIEPLWKGRKFPQRVCVSGWSIIRGETAVIPDIYQDERVLHEAYRPTFVKSMVMVPIREKNPLGAIGCYWSKPFHASDECVLLLRSLANLVAIALENARLLDELRAANQALENTIQSRDEFLSIAAHELRTPLTALKLQLQLLERTNPGAGAGAGALSLRQVGALANLVENLLDISRIRANRLTLHPSRFDLSEVAKECVEEFMPQLRAMKCEVAVTLAAGLEGEWDREKIVQVLSNLLSNACKYAAGAPVSITTRLRHGLAVVEIKDQGPGIRKDQQDRVFERFERGTPGVKHVGGLGLGLYISRQLAEAHRGRILLVSDEGQGAAFTVELPVR